VAFFACFSQLSRRVILETPPLALAPALFFLCHQRASVRVILSNHFGFVRNFSITHEAKYWTELGAGSPSRWLKQERVGGSYRNPACSSGGKCEQGKSLAGRLTGKPYPTALAPASTLQANCSTIVLVRIGYALNCLKFTVEAVPPIYRFQRFFNKAKTNNAKHSVCPKRENPLPGAPKLRLLRNTI